MKLGFFIYLYLVLISSALAALQDESLVDQTNRAIRYRNEPLAQEKVEKLAAAGMLDEGGGHNNEYTALNTACLYDFLPAISLLLKAGADVNAQAPGGMPSLHIACAWESLKTMKVLLQQDSIKVDKRAKLGQYDNEEVFGKQVREITCLTRACKTGNLKIVKLLLENFADARALVDANLPKGETVLDLARRISTPQIADVVETSACSLSKLSFSSDL